MKVVDPATSWSFECVTDSAGKPPPGGLVLQTVTHDGHNFAKDIRVIGFWLTTEQVDPTGKVSPPAKKFYILDDATFTVSAVRTLTPSPVPSPTTPGKTFLYLRETDAALDFASYFKSGDNHVVCGVSADFDAPALLSSFPNCEYAGLTLKQVFLFSRYTNSPKHEPSGGLSAARCHPMTIYGFNKNPSFDPKKTFTRLRSIRFDYRLYLFVDRHHDVVYNATLPQFGNQAGLFADSDSAVGTGVVAFGSGVWNIFKAKTTATAVSRGSFDAVEKPLVLEVMAPGLGKGFSKFKAPPAGGGAPVDVRSWDNVHWWGARGSGAALISTPGAFHCAHLHWRWGAAGKAAGVGSDPHFNPKTYPSGMPSSNPQDGMWGPLVDPKIWIQTIRIAVTKNDAGIDPAKGVAPTALSKDDWESLFKPGLRPAPDPIISGADIVLWYSTEVHRDLTDSSVPPGSPLANPKVPALGSYTSAAAGAVFIHGIFFAHDAEPTGFSITVGSTDPAHRPTDEATIRSAKNWVRTAD